MKEAHKKITLKTLMERMDAMKNEILERIDKLDKEHEQYFTDIQVNLLELNTDVGQLKADVSQLKVDLTGTRQEIKDLRIESNSFHKGFGAKSGRQDAFNFKLVGILESHNILSPNQSIELRGV